MSALEDAWQSRRLLAIALWPLSMLYRLIVFVRRLAYRFGVFRVQESRLPVVVVGNVSVGGTGKTPLCIHLVQQFRKAGWRPAIVSRGYAGERHDKPRLISSADCAAQVGDEPLMMFQQTGVPVCVCVKRAQAVAYLADNTNADIVFADDGLQHLAMARTAEIIVIDGRRGIGNGWLLPAGPLREPAARIAHADIIAVQMAEVLHRSLDSLPLDPIRADIAGNTFTLAISDAISLADGQRLCLSEFTGQPVVAMAGIGHPERFFDALRRCGLQVTGVAKPDHHVYTTADFDEHGSSAILVTSKDAVKLRTLGEIPGRLFEVPATLTPGARLQAQIDRLEQSLRLMSMEHVGQ